MSSNTRPTLRNRLWAVAFYCAAVVWFGFAYGGWVLVSRTEDVGHSRLGGWAILTACLIVMIVGINHWVKFLQVFFGAIAYGGLFGLFLGRLPNGGPFPRVIAAGMIVLSIGCNLVSLRLTRQRLRTLERVALIAFVSAFVLGMCVIGTPIGGLIGLATGYSILLALWIHNRHLRDPESSGREF